MIEGVPYYKFRARWRQAGKRRQVTFWSVGRPWLDSEISRMLHDADAPSGTTVHVTRR